MSTSLSWNCNACTFLNESYKLSCDICLSLKPSSSPIITNSTSIIKLNSPILKSSNSSSNINNNITSRINLSSNVESSTVNTKNCPICTYNQLINIVECAICGYKFKIENININNDTTKNKKIINDIIIDEYELSDIEIIDSPIIRNKKLKLKNNINANEEILILDNDMPQHPSFQKLIETSSNYNFKSNSNNNNSAIQSTGKFDDLDKDLDDYPSLLSRVGNKINVSTIISKTNIIDKSKPTIISHPVISAPIIAPIDVNIRDNDVSKKRVKKKKDAIEVPGSSSSGYAIIDNNATQSQSLEPIEKGSNFDITIDKHCNFKAEFILKLNELPTIIPAMRHEKLNVTEIDSPYPYHIIWNKLRKCEIEPGMVDPSNVGGTSTPLYSVFCFPTPEFMLHVHQNRLKSLLSDVMERFSNIRLVVFVDGLYEALQASMNKQLKQAIAAAAKSKSDVIDFKEFKKKEDLDNFFLDISFFFQSRVNIRVLKAGKIIENLIAITKSLVFFDEDQKEMVTAVSNTPACRVAGPGITEKQMSSSSFKSWFNMLLLIPRVSEKVAAGILKLHPTFSSLFYLLKNKTEAQAIEYLSNLPLNNDSVLNKNTRGRLGPDLANKIYFHIIT